MSSWTAELKEGASAAKFFLGCRDEEVDFPGAELKMEELPFFEDEEEEEEEGESVKGLLAAACLGRSLAGFEAEGSRGGLTTPAPAPREVGWNPLGGITGWEMGNCPVFPLVLWVLLAGKLEAWRDPFLFSWKASLVLACACFCAPPPPFCFCA